MNYNKSCSFQRLYQVVFLTPLLKFLLSTTIKSSINRYGSEFECIFDYDYKYFLQKVSINRYFDNLRKPM